MENVSKSFRRGARTVTALDGVSLRVDPGEHIAVWGDRRSGRTTLLRIAAGMETPDSGAVRVANDIAGRRGWVHASPLATRQAIVDYIALPLLARGVEAAEARERAREQLAKVGASSCAGMCAGELEAADLLRVALAQVLVQGPRLVIVDEPTRDVDVLEREPVMDVLRRVADEGIGVLTTTGEAVGVAGVDRVLTIADGKVRADVAREPATVIPLRSCRVG
jgi:ABC-type lipoprotein export system ATPase subunit